MNTVEVALSVYDNDGIVVDTTTVNLNEDQVSDIVSQAVEVIHANRSNNQAEIELSIAELEEALESYSIIELK